MKSTFSQLKTSLEQLGYSLIPVTAKMKQTDSNLSNYRYKTLPNGAGTHNYFKSLLEVAIYVDDLKFIRGLKEVR